MFYPRVKESTSGELHGSLRFWAWGENQVANTLLRQVESIRCPCGQKLNFYTFSFVSSGRLDEHRCDAQHRPMAIIGESTKHTALLHGNVNQESLAFFVWRNTWTASKFLHPEKLSRSKSYDEYFKFWILSFFSPRIWRSLEGKGRWRKGESTHKMSHQLIIIVINWL